MLLCACKYRTNSSSGLCFGVVGETSLGETTTEGPCPSASCYCVCSFTDTHMPHINNILGLLHTVPKCPQYYQAEQQSWSAFPDLHLQGYTHVYSTCTLIENMTPILLQLYCFKAELAVFISNSAQHDILRRDYCITDHFMPSQSGI